MTDRVTVENVLKELIATTAELANAGRPIRLNFKVGSLIVSNG